LPSAHQSSARVVSPPSATPRTPTRRSRHRGCARTITVLRTPTEPRNEALRTSPSTVAKRLARHFTFGRSRVLTPVPPDQVWVFFRGFPTPSHRGMSHITDKANAGSVSTSQYLPPSFRTQSSPYPSRIFPSV
jgi:hypothetical protein